MNDCNNVIANNFALSDSEGTSKLVVPEGRGDAYKFLDIKNINKNDEGEQIRTVRLDNFLEIHNIDKVDLIKIDVEGAEYLVLNGCEKLFNSSFKPVIIFESQENWAKRFDRSVFETLNYLSNKGYKLEQYEESQWIAIPNN